MRSLTQETFTWFSDRSKWINLVTRCLGSFSV